MLAETVALEPLAVIEPMVLLLIFTTPLLDELIPTVRPPLVDVVVEIEPVPLPLPIVLSVVVPMLTLPPVTLIPHHTPFPLVAPLDVLHEKLATVLF